jgi:hypothetical protein
MQVFLYDTNIKDSARKGIRTNIFTNNNHHLHMLHKATSNMKIICGRLCR